MAKRKIKLEAPEETTEQKLETSGLGDIIANITEAVGIKPCGACERRKAALNKAFPWLKPTREFTQEDIDFMKVVNNSNILQNDIVNGLFRLYNELFNSNLNRCACPGLISKMIQRLNTYIGE